VLPPDWRARMIDMIRGAAPLDGSWFAGSAALAPEQQIGVYRNQYRLRMHDALRAEIPGLAFLLGDGFDEVADAFLADRPPTSWTLNRIADGLADWLAARDAPGAQVDMARLDAAVQRGFEAANGVSLRPGDLTEDPVLVWQPPVDLLRLSWDVHLVRAAVLAEQPPPEPRPAEVRLVVFRRELRMRHWAVESDAWDLLACFRTPCAVSAALESLVAGGADPAALLPDLREWFRLFAERDLVQAAR
jgi:Putative DNA-binding domain